MVDHMDECINIQGSHRPTRGELLAIAKAVTFLPADGSLDDETRTLIVSGVEKLARAVGYHDLKKEGRRLRREMDRRGR